MRGHGAAHVFLDHDSPGAMYARAGLDAKGIVAKVFERWQGLQTGERQLA